MKINNNNQQKTTAENYASPNKAYILKGPTVLGGRGYTKEALCVWRKTDKLFFQSVLFKIP